MRNDRDETPRSQGDPGTPPTIPDLDDWVWLPAAQAIGCVVCDAGYFRVEPIIAAGAALSEFSWYDAVAEATTALHRIATCP